MLAVCVGGGFGGWFGVYVGVCASTDASIGGVGVGVAAGACLGSLALALLLLVHVVALCGYGLLAAMPQPRHGSRGLSTHQPSLPAGNPSWQRCW